MQALSLIRGLLIVGIVIDGSYLILAHLILFPELTTAQFVRQAWIPYCMLTGMLITYWATTLRGD